VRDGPSVEYALFKEEELDAIEAEANKNIELKSFIPMARVDPVYFADSRLKRYNHGLLAR
jgi:non-homologous end joining protein Ku